MKKRELEQSLDLSLKQYDLPKWAKFRGDYNPKSCICNDKGEVVGLILREIEYSSINLPLLEKLQYCSISDNKQLTQLTFQGDFPNLEYVDLSDNALTELTLPNKLESLKTFYAQGNQLSTIDLKEELPNAHFIDLSKNQLEKIDLPDAPNLEMLYLYDNKISHFDFKDLSSLQILDLEKNQLEDLSFYIVDSKQLSTLYLDGNPIKNLPDTILGSGERHNSAQEVMTYLRSLKIKPRRRVVSSHEMAKELELITEEEVLPLHQAKMVLVGNGEVGKSSICIKLLDKEAPLPKAVDRTPGLDILNYPVKELSPSITKLKEPIDFELNIWDFGGQGKYREIQQLFCNPKTLYLFVTAVDDVPTKEDYIGFEYWLSMVNAYSYDDTDKDFAPVLFVVNKTDKGSKDINEKEYRNSFPNIKRFIKISCKTLDNFANLEKAIRKVLPAVNQKMFTDVFHENWMKVRRELENQKAQNHINLAYYFELSEHLGLDKEEAVVWLRVLDRIGDLIYFGENEALKDWIIINPVWVKDALCKVMDSPFIKRGVLEPIDFQNIWPSFSDEEHQHLIALMLAYKLCYEQKNRFGEVEYIVPVLLKPTKPKFPKIIAGQPDLQIKLEYAPFIPAGTVNKLMVDLNDKIYNRLIWKNNVVIQDALSNSYAYIWEDWTTKSVYINYFGATFKNLHYQLISAFDEINDRLKRTRFIHQLGFDIFVFRDKLWDSVETLKRFKKIEYTFLWEKPEAERLPNLKQENINQKKMESMENIRNLIAKGQLDKALNLLSEQFNSAEITQLQERLSTLKKEKRMGVLTTSEANLERNRITSSTLDLLNELKKGGNKEDTNTTQSKVKKEEKLTTKTYISYAWGGDSTEIANLVEKELTERGVAIYRDLSKVGYKDSIQAFMQEIGKGNRVIVIISEKYLKSDNCMYELTQIYQNADFQNRIFPIILSDANIYRPIARIKYIKYWDEKIKELDAELKSVDTGVNLTEIQQELNNYAKIRASFDKMAAILKDMNALNPETHQNENFESLYQQLLAV